MLDEIVDVFRAVPAGVVLDATLGGGGHTEAILDRGPTCGVLGIDRDARRPRRRAAGSSASATARCARCRFDDLDEAMQAHDVDELDRRPVRPRGVVAAARRAERGF